MNVNGDHFKEHFVTTQSTQLPDPFALTFRIALIALTLASAALGLVGCQTNGDLIQQESNLSQAGFVVHIADTAERQAMLNRLPPNQFVLRVHGGVSHYVYADPGCGCLYVGSPQAFSQYVSNQQLDFVHAQQVAIQNYVDPAWNWRLVGAIRSGFLVSPT